MNHKDKIKEYFKLLKRGVIPWEFIPYKYRDAIRRYYKLSQDDLRKINRNFYKSPPYIYRV